MSLPRWRSRSLIWATRRWDARVGITQLCRNCFNWRWTSNAQRSSEGNNHEQCKFGGPGEAFKGREARPHFWPRGQNHNPRAGATGPKPNPRAATRLNRNAIKPAGSHVLQGQPRGRLPTTCAHPIHRCLGWRQKPARHSATVRRPFRVPPPFCTTAADTGKEDFPATFYAIIIRPCHLHVPFVGWCLLLQSSGWLRGDGGRTVRRT